MHRIALVGCGWHSLNHHAPALGRFAEARPGELEVTACDSDHVRAESCKDTFGFARSCASQRDLLNESFEAAILVLPFPLLLESARAWCERGIPILVEKPLGADLDQALRLAELGEKPGNRIMVSLNRRFDPGLNLAKRWFEHLSPVHYVNGSMSRVNRREEDFLWSTGIHLLDAMCYAVGPLTLASGSPPVRIQSPGGCGRAGLLTGLSGLKGSFEILPVCGRIEERLKIGGEGWSVDVWTGTSHPWRVQAFDQGHLIIDRAAEPDEPECIRNGTYSETVDFLDAVFNGTPLPGPQPADALPASRLASELQKLGG